MAKKLTLNLSEKLYSALAKQAKQEGVSVQELARRKLATAGKRPAKPVSDAKSKCADEAFLKSCGFFDSGNPNSADNESIDRDLAREYGRGTQ